MFVTTPLDDRINQNGQFGGNVPVYLPTSASWQIVALVASLRHQFAYPSLDICRAFHVIVVCENLGIFDDDVLNRRVFQILAQAADGYTIATVYGDLDMPISVEPAASQYVMYSHSERKCCTIEA